ncbi:MAG: glycerol-3-phosphate acyltransferase, partial [Lachnospiraceae bacterium]|nr:glycerol-3-phosphate acyltransferase [Lachnospiraceae bacterium]
VLGHDFPIFFGFRGGKGVATSLGVALALNWKVGLIVCAVALTIMIAESRPEEKEMMISVVMNCML